jgi:hypothetical protein
VQRSSLFELLATFQGGLFDAIEVGGGHRRLSGQGCQGGGAVVNFNHPNKLSVTVAVTMTVLCSGYCFMSRGVVYFSYYS